MIAVNLFFRGLAAAALFLFCYTQGLWAAPADTASGVLVNGFRVLNVGDFAGTNEFSVFRGDYIKFDLEKKDSVTVSIPSLGIEKRLTRDLAPVPYFKMKQVGVFDIFIGNTAGSLKVMEYTGAHYRAVSAAEAQEVIQTFSPFILDVRTPKEYKGARIAGADLLPVQQLQKRWTELIPRKDDPILIYCATGNRSTVAAKILIDRGFTRIFNLRHGIVDWYNRKYPIEQ